MKIVFASHSYLSPVFVVGSHQLARQAARAYHEVWHVSAAFSLLHLPFTLRDHDYRTRARLACTTGRQVEPRLWETVPFTLLPWEALRRMREPERAYLRGFRSLRRSAAARGFAAPDLLLIDEPRMACMAELVQARCTIYRPTDVYAKLKRDPVFSEVERRLLARVHGVVATSGPVLEHVKSLNERLPAMVLENGVDVEHIAAGGTVPDDLAAIPRPRAIYVGAVDDRFDGALLARVAALQPGIQFVAIGGDAPSGDRPPNLHYLGRRPYRQMPAYLAGADFAVMPLSSAEANQGRSPMKLFEFAAAGLPVVTSSTEELRRRNLPFVFLADSAESFADHCAHCAASDLGEIRERARGLAQDQSWRAKTEQLLGFARSLLPRSEGLPS